MPGASISCVCLPQGPIPQAGKLRPRRVNRWLEAQDIRIMSEAPFREKDLSPGDPHFWRPATAKGTPQACCADGPWKRPPSPKTGPGEAHARDTRSRLLLRPGQTSLMDHRSPSRWALTQSPSPPHRNAPGSPAECSQEVPTGKLTATPALEQPELPAGP